METEAAKGNYRSYAEQVLKAERLQGRRRNRQGDDTYTPTRERLEEEAAAILTAQPRRERLGRRRRLSKVIVASRSSSVLWRAAGRWWGGVSLRIVESVLLVLL